MADVTVRLEVPNYDRPSGYTENEGVPTPITFEETTMISINAKFVATINTQTPSNVQNEFIFTPCFSYSTAILIAYQKENLL